MGARHRSPTRLLLHPTRLPHKHPQDRAAVRLLTQVINADWGDPATQEWLLENLCRILGAEAGLLLLLNDGRHKLVVKDHQSGQSAHVYEAQPDWKDGPIEKCLSQKSPLRWSPPAPIPQTGFLGHFSHLRPSSLVCVPLLVDNQPLGAIAALNKSHVAFSTHDLELLQHLANSVAHAIHNMRLIQQLKVANADLEVSHWQLLRSRNTLRALFDSIPASIYIIDHRYTLMAINMYRANQVNTPPNRLVGRRCYEALYQRDDICPDCRVLETLRDGKPTNRSKRQWNGDDDAQEWEISSFPIHDEQNQVIQAILLEQDVTEKRHLEATLAQSEKLAAVGQLAAGIAHEINNPLTAIIANAQLLQREIQADDERQELVELILRAGNRATQVVRNLLDLVRKEQYEFAPTDINETIRQALAFLQHEFITHSVKLVFEAAPNLPKVMASQDHLQGVWLNLLTNALDSLESGPNEIRVTTRQQGNEVRVTVADTGKGIPPDRLSRIFEPFYTTKAPGRGTGLGLSVCHRVIKRHGGRILVDSQINVGTQFTVILPLPQ